jgi:hypothetical protein
LSERLGRRYILNAIVQTYEVTFSRLLDWTGGSISPEVDGVVFICDDLDDKARLVVGGRENGRGPVVVVRRKVLQRGTFKGRPKEEYVTTAPAFGCEDASTGKVLTLRWVHGFVDQTLPTGSGWIQAESEREKT